MRLPSRSAPRRSPGQPLHERAAAFVRGLPDHPLLDRIVRGRTWIVLLGVLLAGIVAMQVEMLKLGASVGRSIQLGTALQSRNELLRVSVSALSDDRRIERLASGMGMVMPGPTSLGFLDANRINLGRAATSIHAPNASAFQTALQAMNATALSSVGGPLATGPVTGSGPASGLGATGTGPPTSAGTSVGATAGQATTIGTATGGGTPTPGATGIATGVTPASGAGAPTGSPTGGAGAGGTGAAAIGTAPQTTGTQSATGP